MPDKNESIHLLERQNRIHFVPAPHGVAPGVAAIQFALRDFQVQDARPLLACRLNRKGRPHATTPLYAGVQQLALVTWEVGGHSRRSIAPAFALYHPARHRGRWSDAMGNPGPGTCRQAALLRPLPAGRYSSRGAMRSAQISGIIREALQMVPTGCRPLRPPRRPWRTALPMTPSGATLWFHPARSMAMARSGANCVPAEHRGRGGMATARARGRVSPRARATQSRRTLRPATRTDRARPAPHAREERGVARLHRRPG